MPPRSTRSGLRKDVGQVVAQQGRVRGRCGGEGAARSPTQSDSLALVSRSSSSAAARPRNSSVGSARGQAWHRLGGDALLIILKAPPLRIIVALASAAR